MSFRLILLCIGVSILTVSFWEVMWWCVGGIPNYDLHEEWEQVSCSAPQNPQRKLEIVAGLKYGGHERQALDIYIPETAENYPVAIFIHGGCWESGDKNMYGSMGRYFAGKGIGVVTINYRLSPDIKHPGHIEDVAQAFAWVYENIAKFGGDPNRIYIAGHSSGAHLAALIATNNQYLQKHKLDYSKIKGVVAMSGIYNLNFTLKIAGLNYIFPSEKDKIDASPIRHVKPDCPPFLILYAENDIKTLPTQARNMHAVLTKAGCKSVIKSIPDKNHYTIMFDAVTSDSTTNKAILSHIK